MESHDGPAQFADEQAIKKVAAAIEGELGRRPPTIGLVGVSGVGKSSTLNALFRTSLPISHTVACTKEFRAVDLEVTYHDKATGPRQAQLTVIDAPGLGEDVAKDDGYLRMYQQNLGRCDVVLWVTSARNRAVALDQMYLARLKEHHARIVLAVNQVDLVEPRDWVEKYNIPSETQEKHIKAIQADRAEKIGDVIGRNPPTVSYSANRGFDLEALFATVLRSCPPDRRWIYGGLKNFKYTDFIHREGADGAGPRATGLMAKLFARNTD